MSSYWFNSTEPAETDVADADSNHPSNLISILAALQVQLPLLRPQNLSFDEFIGKGGSYEVSREIVIRPGEEEWRPYYVAVKRIAISGYDTEKLKRQYDSVLRDLRVLTHPGLMHNNSIISILGYGWTSSFENLRPYLVMEYAEFGTLDGYLSRFKPDIRERHEFAKDVAYGLKDLHDSKIIHGDLKPKNILIFGSRFRKQSFVAKLADFGSSIFELDENQLTSYAGTALYNSFKGNELTVKSCVSFYQDDIYAFGITLWEIMKNGRAYIEDTWLMHEESRKDFLERIWREENEDAVLQRAQEFCNSLIQEHNNPTDLDICGVIRETFDLTLKGDGSLRATIDRVVIVLVMDSKYVVALDGIIVTDSFSTYSRREIELSFSQQTLVPSASKRRTTTHSKLPENLTIIPPNEPASIHHRSGTTTFAHLRLVNWVQVHDTSQMEDISRQERSNDENTDSERTVATLSRPGAVKLTHFIPGRFNLLESSMSADPPWELQQETARLLSRQVESKRSKGQPEYFDACLQLALCYHIGYGVEPNSSRMFDYLTMSLEGHSYTKAIYHRLLLALGSKNFEAADISFETELDHALELREQANPEDYFADRVRIHQRIQMSKTSFTPHSQIRGRDLSSVPLKDFLEPNGCALLSLTLSDNKYTDEEVSTALTLACKKGDAGAAMKLCAYCNKFIVDPEVPSPLHWLIMFDAKDAEALATALVGHKSQYRGPCRDLLNSQSSAGEDVIILADHCLDLFGTPLHWAVRTRNKTLVRLLCHLGADINIQWKTNLYSNADIGRPRWPPLRPLDLAVQYHLPEIIELLLALGAQWHGASFGAPSSALLCIGKACIPFSRYMLHGDAFLDALHQTLAVISKHGYDINEKDSFGYTALMILLQDCDCEAYVVEGLLKAGASADGTTFDNDANVAVIIASSSSRRHNTGNLSLVIDHISNINALDRMGRNALHYSAILGNIAIATILCNHDSIDVDMKSLDRETALHFAAIFGNADVITTLIKKGAYIEATDKDGSTALELAAFHKRKSATDILLRASADSVFKSTRGGNVLHSATANIRSETTMVSYLLQAYPELRSTAILNGVDPIGRTPLHRAADYGDYDAVHALLAYGANRELLDGGWNTPYDLVLGNIKTIERGNIGPTYTRIWKKPLHVRRRFLAALQEIGGILENHNKSTQQHLCGEPSGEAC